jgi:HK97 family phage major capsid protein
MSIARSIGDLNREFESRESAADFWKWGLAQALAKGDPRLAMDTFQKHRPHSRNIPLIKDWVRGKSAITIGGTQATPPNWAETLAQLRLLGSAYLDVIRPRTVIGRMTGFRSAPFGVKVPLTQSGTTADWVGEDEPYPVSSMALDSISFKQAKIGFIVPFTRELAALRDSAAERSIQRDLVNAVIAAEDKNFLDPNVEAVANKNPASITNGATSITSTGATADKVEADFVSLFAAVTTNFTNPYLVMRPKTAINLAVLRTTSGDRLFPNCRIVGGDILGVPIITSTSVQTIADSPASSRIVLIDAAEILLAEGDIEMDSSGQATLRLTDQSSDSPVLATETEVSLWQKNLIGVRVTKYVNWARGTDAAVAYIDHCDY